MLSVAGASEIRSCSQIPPESVASFIWSPNTAVLVVVPEKSAVDVKLADEVVIPLYTYVKPVVAVVTFPAESSVFTRR